jgi:phosphoribosylformimino-5-aminoimidazole carboxamide ribotide isomerase
METGQQQEGKGDTDPVGQGTGTGFVIPAIDIIDGKCVRLTQGDYALMTSYHDDPLEMARQFEDAGLKRLHLVDLDGAKSGKVKNWKVLERIASGTELRIDFGGGLKTGEDLEIVLGSGAAFATIGSLAVKNEPLFTEWISRYGPEKFLLGADTKDEKIVVHGWQETTRIDVFDFIRYYLGKGIQQVFCTDTRRDGMLEGPAFDLSENIVTSFPSLHFIASGGVSSVEDLRRLRSIGCKGVIVGKAIYEGRIKISELSNF